MTGTNPLLDPDGNRRAAMAASLEFGTHPIVGQHLYRREAVSTIPVCGRCGRQRVLYGGVCSRCLDIEDREDNR